MSSLFRIKYSLTISTESDAGEYPIPEDTDTEQFILKLETDYRNALDTILGFIEMSEEKGKRLKLDVKVEGLREAISGLTKKKGSAKD